MSLEKPQVSDISENMTQFIIYTNSTFLCPYCIRAKQAFTDHNYSFEERDIASPPVKAELLASRPSARTVPQIFLANGYYIGGCDDLVTLIEQGRLDIIIDANT